MTILRVGTNEKYADGWSTAFGSGKEESCEDSSQESRQEEIDQVESSQDAS